MMDELKQQFYEVMHKYQKPFSEEGVTANLTQWNEPKQGLLQLLRRHPLWNEKELAIVFRVEERREIDRITVDETRAAILELGRRACTDDTVYENFETALRAATADYARIPNEYRLDTIRQYGGIKCAPGQKASRIINRLCMKFHLDQIEEEAEAGEPDNRYMRTVKPYNALFARLADALNPAHIEKTAVLSIHPCDFLEMSNRDNTWSSCHCLEGGGYRGGCQSYMGDAVSMIFFTVSDEYTQDFHTAPRITREIFCYKDNVLLQSRLYPTDLEDQKTLYRSIVQQAIATCLDKPNLWSIKRGKETEPYCESAVDSNHYPDYEYGYAVVSLLKGESDYGKMTIGSVARCVCCGGEQKNHRSIRCAECGNMYVCKGCGKTVHGYGRYIDNHFYCNECSYECTVCKEMRDEGETKLTPQEQSLNEEIEKLQDQWPYLMNEIFFIDYLKNPTYERGLAAKSKILVCFNDELLAAFLSAYKKANISEQQEMLTILKEISFRGGAVERDETDTEVTRKNLEKLENALNSEVEHTSDAVKKFYANRHLETVKQIRQKFLNTREM